MYVGAGAEGQRGRVQVHQEVQGVQHQQPVGESESHQETAGRGDHEGGGHRQQEGEGEGTRWEVTKERENVLWMQ